MPAREVIFEHVALQNVAKCTAIDSATALEVSVMGPAHAAQRDMEQLALAKLMKRLKAEAGNL